MARCPFSGKNDLMSFPSIALRIPTVHNFTRDYGGFLFAAGPRHRDKSSFSR